jgi:hypothetical protein
VVAGGQGVDEAAGEALHGRSPFRFCLWVDAVDADRAAAALASVTHTEFSWSVGPAELVEPGTACLDVQRSNRTPVAEALGPALGALHVAGVSVRRYAQQGTLRDVRDTWLRRQLDGYGPTAGRRRLESLAGDVVLGQLLRCTADADGSWEVRAVAAWACGFALLNEPTSSGCDRVLTAAAEQSGALPARLRYPLGDAVENLVGAVGRLSSTLSPVGLMPHVDLGPTAVLLAHPSQKLHAAAAGLLARLPGARPDAVLAALLPVARAYADRKGQDAGVVATDTAYALAHGPGTPDVVAALRALSRHDQAETRRAAVEALGQVGGRDLVQPLWDGLIASRSPSERVTGSALVARYGSADDVPVAVSALRRALASRNPRRWDDPPWGAGLLQLLWRHRDDPTAAAELASVSARWTRLHPDLRSWVAQHLPELAPHASPGEPPNGDAPPLP